MELALLVWVISMLTGIKTLLILTAVTCVVCGTFIGLYCFVEGEALKTRVIVTVFVTAIVSIVLNVVIPSERTAYIMAGAYATQKIAEDPKVQQLGAKTLKLIENKLDQYIDQADKAVAK